MLSWSSSTFSSGSLNISHHLPLSTASCGRAGCQAPGSTDLYASGEDSLNAGADGAAGVLYFGPTLHAPSANANAKISAPHCNIRGFFIAQPPPAVLPADRLAV